MVIFIIFLLYFYYIKAIRAYLLLVSQRPASNEFLFIRGDYIKFWGVGWEIHSKDKRDSWMYT